MIPKILLSFDVEEFDMPLDYKRYISINEQMSIGKMGLDSLTAIFNDEKIKTTLFTTANFATNFPDDIKYLSQKHEIASHSLFHSFYNEGDLLKSRIILNNIINKNITGLRMPRMKQVPVSDIINAGYLYDASIHPTFLPGRYNNLKFSRTIYNDQGLIRIPASVSPNFRIPFFWLSFKNFPFSMYTKLALKTLRNDGYLSLYFHPWEFVNITKFGLPKFTIKGCEGYLLDKLDNLINVLKKEGQFITMNEFANQM